MEWHQAGYDQACWSCGCSGKPPSHRPISSPLPSTTPALVLLGQWTGWQPHGCTGLDVTSAGCSAHPPVSQFEQTGLETSACRTNFIKKVWVVWDLVWNKQKRNNSCLCLRRTISKQGPYILLRQGTSQVMNVGLPWPFQETLTLTDYRQINTQQ